MAAPIPCRKSTAEVVRDFGHYGLLEGADVFVQNFRPGVIECMVLDEAVVRASAPDIVYVSISGFGDRGPHATKPVYDPLVQALSGLTTIQAGSDGERPRFVRTILPDKLTGITAAQAITAALVARLLTGKGQHVKLSMLESVIAFLWHSDMGSQTFVEGNIPQQEAQSFIDLIYETADGYITVSLMTDRQWKAAAEAMERPDWLTDPRFSTAARRQEISMPASRLPKRCCGPARRRSGSNNWRRPMYPVPPC